MADQGPTGDPQPGGFDAVPSQGGAGNELHEQFISSVPENLREAAQQIVPIWDKHVQGKFQEAAEYRKTWEPYQSLGLSNHQPQDIEQALAIHAAINDNERLPELYQQLTQYMQSNGLLNGRVGGEPDPYEDEDFGADPVMQEMQTLRQQVEQQSQFIQQFQQQQAQQQAQQFVDQQLAALRSEHPSLTDEDEDVICTMAMKYEGMEAIKKGFADYQKLVSRAEQGIFQKKTEAPAPANSGGVAATKPEAITSYEDARKAALERLAQSQQ